MILKPPNREGYTVVYYTGEVGELKNGGIRKVQKSCICTTEEERDKKAKELKAEGKEIFLITECMY